MSWGTDVGQGVWKTKAWISPSTMLGTRSSDDVSDKKKTIGFSYLSEDFREYGSETSGGKQRQAAVASAGDEVQVPIAGMTREKATSTLNASPEK